MLTASPNRVLGFGLIELMVAIAIMTVLATLALPSYRTWMQDTRIRTVAESVQNGLQIARAEAVKRNATINFSVTADTAWSIGCVTITADCPEIIQSRSANDGSSSTISVDGGSVDFNNLGTASAPMTFNIASSEADTRSLRVTLGPGGDTKMCDPALSNTDPRAC